MASCLLCPAQASAARSPAQGAQSRSVRYLAQYPRPQQGHQGQLAAPRPWPGALGYPRQEGVKAGTSEKDVGSQACAS